MRTIGLVAVYILGIVTGRLFVSPWLTPLLLDAAGIVSPNIPIHPVDEVDAQVSNNPTGDSGAITGSP